MNTSNASVDKVIDILSNLDPKDLQVINRAISMSSRRKVPVKDVGDLISHQEAGNLMTFQDRKGRFHVGLIKKINQKYVMMFDKNENRHYSILPEALSVATQSDIKRAEGQEPNVMKRMYTKRKDDASRFKKDKAGNIVWGRRKTDVE